MVTTVTTGHLLASDLDEVLERGGALWNELRGAHLFLTGGTGFVGRWLLETLLWANDRRHLGVSVTALTRRPEQFGADVPHLASHPSVRLIEGDARSFAFPDGRFTHVVHAASDSSPLRDQDSRRRLFDTTVVGTRRALEFARVSGARRFLFTSSGAIYGRQPADLDLTSEDYSGGPDPAVVGSVYGEAKRAAEMLCVLNAGTALHPIIARLFAFIGPYLPLDANFAAGNFVRDALAGGPIHVSGDGTPYRSYLYASDLALWLWTLLVDGQSARAYNVGSPEPVSIRELAERVSRAAGGVRVDIARQPAPGAAPERYVPSTRRAEEELAVSATVSLDEAIRRTLAWHRGRVSA
jgi:dTDP-glucose 4,6-dehydratase